MTRQKVKRLIADLAAENPKVPSNILGAIGNIKPSQLMDDSLWNFTDLESQLEKKSIFDTVEQIRTSVVDLAV